MVWQQPSEFAALRAARAAAAVRTAGAPGSRPQTGSSLVRNVVYRVDNGVPLALDIYKPAGQAPPGGWPALLAIHGGGWQRYDKEQYGPQVGPPLAHNGYVVVVPDFTQAQYGAPSWPANLEDLRAALQWMRANRSTIGIDPARIGAIGESSGAHLALLLSVYPAGPVLPYVPPPASSVSSDSSTRVSAVVDFSGPTDLTTLVPSSPVIGGARAEEMLNAVPTVNPFVFLAASPLTYINSTSPPMFIVHGGNDPVVPPTQSQELVAALTAAGVPHQFNLVPGVGHVDRGVALGSHNFLPQILAFLHTYLGASRPVV
ncbi:MAG TPA: alpha/beta hydrolase [Isosphaeraceae bacterium]|nr:alpha/beta hydrolase [Isosphaeraceae bacterium]